MGRYLMDGLKRVCSGYPFVADVRGRGLMVALELTIDRAQQVVEEALKRGLLINATSERVLRFLPPLIITKDDVERMLSVLDGIFADIEG